MSSLNQLPDITFVDEDVNKTINNLVSTFEAVSGRKLFPADPIRLFLLATAQMLSHQHVLINHGKKLDHLKYARGDFLDHIGARSETKRLPAAAAKTTVRFTLSAPRPSAVTIPAGTRVTGGGSQLFFVTDNVAEIRPGELSLDIACSCTTSGLVGNGFLVGQIDTLVDPIPFVANVRNNTESSGGAEIESDDSYRDRIRTAPESFSVAGPVGAYQYWAKTASPAIIDVSVSSPAPGEVRVVPLLTGGGMPTQDILNAVTVALNDRKVRPLTDRVTVAAPTTKPYTIDLSYWIIRERAAEAVTIQSAVAQAVNDFVVWQKSKLGRDVNPSELIRRVMLAGAHRVDVVSPTYGVIAAAEIAVTSTPTVTYRGLADD
ncbi:baseplate assembly protein [Paenibacillus sp. 481]|uniref:baseplate assembly protein n=1 Tax=Paenibacillus sp. 481 TaxID=2835869 RepID=UPI001E410631|nr:baseplate J/gp47 family protein [Paenibacillus sp. 481]UHA74454.1 baseplate J/gp47 family protein [Paenibacillus sp. 481]